MSKWRMNSMSVDILCTRDARYYPFWYMHLRFRLFTGVCVCVCIYVPFECTTCRVLCVSKWCVLIMHVWLLFFCIYSLLSSESYFQSKYLTKKTRYHNTIIARLMFFFYFTFFHCFKCPKKARRKEFRMKSYQTIEHNRCFVSSSSRVFFFIFLSFLCVLTENCNIWIRDKKNN